MRYNWQHPQWPSFTYDAKNIEFIIQQYILEAGQTLGIAQSIDEESGEEVLVGLMVEEALKTSQIEGRILKLVS